MPRVVQCVETRVHERTAIIRVLRQRRVAQDDVASGPGPAGDKLETGDIDIDGVRGPRRDTAAERPVDESLITTPEDSGLGIPASQRSHRTELNVVGFLSTQIGITAKQTRSRARV